MSITEEKKTEILEKNPLLADMAAGKEIVWLNPGKLPFEESMAGVDMSMDDVLDADARLRRFAPLIMRLFPETVEKEGLIESPLAGIPNMRTEMEQRYGCEISGRIFMKRDDMLAIAGSVKARGGIYEVLKYTEKIAQDSGLLKDGDYAKLASPEARELFSGYEIVAGSTGNLGLSIGIMGAALGYKVTVHMSADAKPWKKALLREKGVNVIEHEGDYTEAVAHGREEAKASEKSYFIDDESSRDLFLGYATAALRLRDRLEELDVAVDSEHPLYVYLPCGVGGAPGGITFGLKQVYGDDVHCYFIEPVEAPCMTLGLISGMHDGISVEDIGLTGRTAADGLAVSRPSHFVGRIMAGMLDGALTMKDAWIKDYTMLLDETEKIYIEPSSTAAFHGLRKIADMSGVPRHATHLVWATGGSLVPAEER